MPIDVQGHGLKIAVTTLEIGAFAQTIAAELEAAGHDVLLDDRDERPGVKFKDADLVGIPYRVNVGKTVVEGKVEVVTRATKERQDVEIAHVVGIVDDLTLGSLKR